MLQVKSDFPSYPDDGSYFDSATMGLQPASSIRAQMEYRTHHPYTVRKSLHRRSRVTETIYYTAKEYFSSVFGVKENELAFIPNSDFGIQILLYSLLNYSSDKKPRIISSVYDHHSLLSPLLELSNRKKIDLTLLKGDEESYIVEFLENVVQEGDIVCFGHTTQVLGLYRNLEEIGKISKDLGGLTMIDFSRTAGQTSLDLEQLKIDIGIFDGSIDLLGPVMSGFFYLSDNLVSDLNTPFLGSGNIGRVTSTTVERLQGIEKFELGSLNIPGIFGLQTSVQYLQQLGSMRIMKHRKEVTSYLIKQLEAIDQISIIDPFLDRYQNNMERSSIIALKSDLHAHDIALLLDENYNVQIRSGLLCSHPGVTDLGLEEVLQISTHIYTTKEDVDRLIMALSKILKVFAKN